MGLLPLGPCDCASNCLNVDPRSSNLLSLLFKFGLFGLKLFEARFQSVNSDRIMGLGRIIGRCSRCWTINRLVLCLLLGIVLVEMSLLLVCFDEEDFEVLFIDGHYEANHTWLACCLCNARRNILRVRGHPVLLYCYLGMTARFSGF